MVMERIYFIGVAILITIGALMIYSALPRNQPRFRPAFASNLRAGFERKLHDESAAVYFQQFGIKLSGERYNAIRLAVFIVLIVLSIVRKSWPGFLFAVLLILASEPEEKLFGTKSPFLRVLEQIRKRRGEKYDDEIYSACVLLKNMAVAQKDHPWGADFIFTQLLDSTKLLKPMIADMLLTYRLGNADEAFRQLAERIGTQRGREFVQILSKIDSLNPIENVEQLTIFQDNLQEQKLTEELKKAESRSNIVYATTTVTVLVLIVNFAMIVIFMDAMSQISNFSVF